MAQRVVLILNQLVPQIQEPQVADSYLMPRPVEIQGAVTVTGNVGVTGDIAVTGTVDGVDIAATAGVANSALQPGDNVSQLVNDAGYTNDQTGAEIKAALFAEADTNNFNDVAEAKVAAFDGMASQGEAEAGVNNTKLMTPLRVAQAIAVFSDSLLNNYSAVTDPIGTNDVNDGYSVGSIWINQVSDEIFRCIDPAAGLAVWIKTSLTIDELATVAVSGNSDDLTEGAAKLLMTVAERAKLTGIEAGATADQTGAEIKTLYQAEVNAFTDALFTKLAGIEALADVTDTANVAAAGAFMADGSATMTGLIPRKVATGITAYATGGQADAVALTGDFNEISVCATGGDSVKLPAAVAGKSFWVGVLNNGANAANVFPASGDNHGSGVDTAFFLAAGAFAMFCSYDATNWKKVI